MDRHEIWTELSVEEQAEVSSLSRVRLGMPPKGAMVPRYSFARPEPKPQSKPFKSIRCAHCKGHHQTIAQVRLCAERQRRSREG